MRSSVEKVADKCLAGGMKVPHFYSTDHCFGYIDLVFEGKYSIIHVMDSRHSLRNMRRKGCNVFRYNSNVEPFMLRGKKLNFELIQ